jgi:hypothetical protein
MATQEALVKDDLTHMHQGSGQSIGGTKMMQGEGERTQTLSLVVLCLVGVVQVRH